MPEHDFAGWHLTYDALVHAEKALSLVDVDFLGQGMRGLATLLGLEAVSVPVVSARRDGGMRGTFFHSDGHLHLYTRPAERRFSLDLFSTKFVACDEALEFLWERFGVERRSSHWIPRNWP